VKFGWGPLGQNENVDVALVRSAREGVGDDPDLMIDAGLCYDTKTAIQRAEQFSEYRPYWFEEPLQPDNYEGYRRLAESTSMRIAAGEEESNRLSYLELMDKGKTDIASGSDALRGIYGSYEDCFTGCRSRASGRQSRIHHVYQHRFRATLPGFDLELLHS
jgi:Enolase C-terminal domain-like